MATPAPGEIAIVTGYTPDIADYGTLSAENKRRYAERHGYNFQCITDGFVPDRPPAWSKIRFIRDALRLHRFVFWSDADALVMNPAIQLESLIEPRIDVHLTRALAPFPHINTGHMLFRRSAFSSAFLRAAWSLEVFRDDPAWEQRAINHLVENYCLRRLKISPNRRFNSYGHVPNDPVPYELGDFVIHFPGQRHEKKNELMAHYAQLCRISAQES